MNEQKEEFTSIFYADKEKTARGIATHCGSTIEIVMGLNDNVMFIFTRPDGQETYMHIGVEAALAMSSLIYDFKEKGYFDATVAKIKESYEVKDE